MVQSGLERYLGSVGDIGQLLSVWRGIKYFIFLNSLGTVCTCQNFCDHKAD